MAITLTFEAIPESEAGVASWPLRVTAVSDTEGLDSNIFVFHAQGDTQATPGDACECVASIIQMNELPVDEPGEVDGELVPFYRKDSAEFHFYTSDELDEAMEIIRSDVSLLLRAHRTFAAITEIQTEVIE